MRRARHSPQQPNVRGCRDPEIKINNIKHFLMFIYFFERERQQGRWGQRERETQNPKQAPGSELSAQSPTQDLNSQTVRS